MQKKRLIFSEEGMQEGLRSQAQCTEGNEKELAAARHPDTDERWKSQGTQSTICGKRRYKMLKDFRKKIRFPFIRSGCSKYCTGITHLDASKYSI